VGFLFLKQMELHVPVSLWLQSGGREAGTALPRAHSCRPYLPHHRSDLLQPETGLVWGF